MLALTLAMFPGIAVRGADTVEQWGMYEFSLSDPDGVLVRVGWPSRLVRD